MTKDLAEVLGILWFMAGHGRMLDSPACFTTVRAPSGYSASRTCPPGATDPPQPGLSQERIGGCGRTGHESCRLRFS